MSVVHEDDEGIFIKTGGYVFRPGGIVGSAHAYRMDDGGLRKGDRVKARHKGGTTLAAITLDDGTKRIWASQYEHDRPGRKCDQDPDAEWNADGTRKF